MSELSPILGQSMIFTFILVVTLQVFAYMLARRLRGQERVVLESQSRTVLTALMSEHLGQPCVSRLINWPCGVKPKSFS